MDERPFGPALRQSVQRLREAMAASGAFELELQAGTTVLRLVRGPGVAETLVEPVPEAPPREATVSAPAIGVFRFAPGRALAAGEQVSSGEVVGTIEVLGIAHEVRVDQTGTVLDVLVHDGEPVEYGQPLVRLGPPSGPGTA